MFLNVPAGATGSGTVSPAGFMDCFLQQLSQGESVKVPRVFQGTFCF